jgi:class 3 adenylate cyclase
MADDGEDGGRADAIVDQALDALDAAAGAAAAAGLAQPAAVPNPRFHALIAALRNERAAPDVVKAMLDRFCATVAARAAAHGGRVHQVVGHAHLVVFGADGAAALDAVRCALDLDAVFHGDDGTPGIAAGIHNGSAVTGVFGSAEATSYVEAGSPVVVARAASEHAPVAGSRGAPRGVVVSETVRALISNADDLRITRLGPVWVAGVRAAVPFAVVELVNTGDA